MTRPSSTLCVAAIALLVVGCTGEPFLSGDELDELFGVTPPPQDPGWVVAWFSFELLVVECAVQRAEIVDASPVELGAIGVEPPQFDPLTTHDWEGLNWALGLPILVDRERYETPQEDEGTIDDLLSFDNGVWGIADLAWFQVDGEQERLEQEFPLLLNANELLEEGGGWVGVFSAAFVDDREIGLSLFPEWLEDDDVLGVTWTEWADGDQLAVWSGDAREGAIGGCGW